MISIHNIRTVARYEAKTLRRSWLFRLFSVGSLLILALLNIGLFSPLGDESWELLAIPSLMPLVNLYMINIAQSFIIIFLASDFLKRDKKLDTNEVLYTRPMSNMEYIAGKSLGIMRLFIGVNILALIICLIINITSPKVTIDALAYLEYLLLVSIPTLVFSLGFAYLLMSIIKNQALTFLFLLGLAALNIFYLYNRMNSFFDYMLFGFPVFKSDMTGFADPDLILAQRIMYTSMGLLFIFASILLFKRLPQSKSHRVVSIFSLVIFAVISGYSAYYFLNDYYSTQKLKTNTLETNRKYEKYNFLSVGDAGIEIDYRENKIYAKTILSCINDNDESLPEILFSLNPGLSVTGAGINGVAADYVTDNHIIKINPAADIQPGASVNIELTYNGIIEEGFCYPWHTDDIKKDEFSIGPVGVKKKQVIQKKNFLLLTPETHWYPVAALNFYPSAPAKIQLGFTKFRLKVKRDNHLVAVSQGARSSDDDYWYFINEEPLTGLSLIEGHFISDTIRVDSTDFIAHYCEGHDYFREDLSEISDTISNLISGIMTELETSFSARYPFKNLNLVEVPVYFHSFEKKNTQTRAEVQPSMILLPEKMVTISDAGFYHTIKRQKNRMERNNQVVTDKELQVRAFNSFVRNTFITGSDFNFNRGNASISPGRYLLGPSFYFYKNNFYSEEYPVINAVFETHLQKVDAPQGGFQRIFLGGLSENDRANTILRDHSMQEIMAMNPSNDTTRAILTVKGDYLFNLIRVEAGIEEFNNWFSGYLEQNKFRKIELAQFSGDLYNRFGFDLDNYLRQWYYGKKQPGFIFTDITVNEIIVGNRTRYKVTFTAANPESTTGIFNVSFRTGEMGPGGGRGMGGSISVSIGPGGRGSISVTSAGRGMQTNDLEKIVKLDAGQAKRISVILDGQPRGMFINTLFSMNNPGELQFPLIDITGNNTNDITEGERILDKLPSITEDNEIIVDNEDPGFRIYQEVSSGRLKQWLNIGADNGNDYREMFMWWAPEYWQKTVQSNYYGKYIKSAVYTRAGSGERYITWTASIDQAGYYDVYTYIGKQGGNRMFLGRGGEGRDRNAVHDLHFSIEHDDGTEDIIVEWENAESGWNLLGSYYLSPDSARVMLTNQSEGRTVNGDAIKWVKQNIYK